MSEILIDPTHNPSGILSETVLISTAAAGQATSIGGNSDVNSNVRKRKRTVSIASRLSHLVEYNEAPADLEAWIAASSLTSMTYSSEYGRRVADYNIKRIASAEINPSDIGLAAAQDPDEGESRDCDFLASSDIIFFEFIGSPGKLAYIQCIGNLDCNINNVEFKNRRFKLESPTHFLVAAGAFLTIAEQ